MIADQGMGMPPGYDQTQQLGATIIRSLAKQVGAELRVSSEQEQGATALLRLPAQTGTA